MLMLVCQCGHEGPLPEELSCRVVCSVCGAAREFVCFDGPDPFEEWRLYQVRRLFLPPAQTSNSNALRIEWRDLWERRS